MTKGFYVFTVNKRFLSSISSAILNTKEPFLTHIHLMSLLPWTLTMWGQWAEMQISRPCSVNFTGWRSCRRMFISRLHGFPEITCSVANDLLLNYTCHNHLPWLSGLFSESSSSWDFSKNEKNTNTTWYLTHWLWNGTYMPYYVFDSLISGSVSQQ